MTTTAAQRIPHTTGCTGPDPYITRGVRGDVLIRCRSCGKFAFAPAGTEVPTDAPRVRGPLVVPPATGGSRGWRNRPGRTRNGNGRR